MALLVGAIGIANIMVISVLERRGEIGLRRALGATKRHISIQFLAESALLAALGGIAGLLLGAIATLVYAAARGQPWVVPLYALIAYARHFAGEAADEATMVAVDRLGFRLRLRSGQRLHGVRIAFPREVRTAGESRTVLIEMLAQARSGS